MPRALVDHLSVVETGSRSGAGLGSWLARGTSSSDVESSTPSSPVVQPGPAATIDASFADDARIASSLAAAPRCADCHARYNMTHPILSGVF